MNATMIGYLDWRRSNRFWSITKKILLPTIRNNCRKKKRIKCPLEQFRVQLMEISLKHWIYVQPVSDEPWSIRFKSISFAQSSNGITWIEHSIVSVKCPYWSPPVLVSLKSIECWWTWRNNVSWITVSEVIWSVSVNNPSSLFRCSNSSNWIRQQLMIIKSHIGWIWGNGSIDVQPGWCVVRYSYYHSSTAPSCFKTYIPRLPFDKTRIKSEDLGLSEAKRISITAFTFRCENFDEFDLRRNVYQTASHLHGRVWQ